MQAKALKIRADAELQQELARQKQELEHRRATGMHAPIPSFVICRCVETNRIGLDWNCADALDIQRKQKDAQIEAERFKNMVDAIGPATIQVRKQRLSFSPFSFLQQPV